MSSQPIFDAIEAGHWCFTVTETLARKHNVPNATVWVPGELRCRNCHQLMPCSTLLMARREAGPMHSMATIKRMS